MRRLLLTSCLVLTIVLVAFIVSLSLLAPSTPSIEQKIYGGGFALLEQTLKTENNALWQRHTIDQNELDQLGIDNKTIKTLLNAEISVVELSGIETVIQQSAVDKSRYFAFDLEQSFSAELDAQFRDLLELIDISLNGASHNKAENTLVKLNEIFEMPITGVTDIESKLALLSAEERQQLERYHIIALDGGIYDGGSLLAKLRKANTYIQMGPLHLSFFESLTNGRWMFTSLKILFGLMVVFLSLLLVWPLWRNIKQLRTFTDAFGERDLDIRAPVSALSPLRDVSIAYNKMATRIQQLVQTQTGLTSALAHEIRTPLSRMRFRLESIVDSNQIEKQLVPVEKLLTDISDLESLADEMLKYAELGTDNTELFAVPTEIVPWTKILISKFTSDDISIELRIEDLDKNSIVNLDQRQTEIAVSNLLNNALAYASKSIFVELKMSSNHIQFIVNDDGPGVDPQVQPRVFEPFFRADDSRNKQKGRFGLGLSIVKRACQLHGGDCTVDSSPLGGARFVISLPRYATSASA